jgi:CelD/BcsL family acetyltransferase involved in cellulose biosynthesis
MSSPFQEPGGSRTVDARAVGENSQPTSGPKPVPAVDGRWGGAEIIEELAPDWRALCDEGPSDQPFYRPEWVGAYVRAFASAQRLLVITARIGGELQALLPLVEERRSLAGMSVRVLRSAANVHSSRFDLVRGRGASGDAATAAVWRFLKECPCWDKLEFDYVPAEAGLEGLVSAAAHDSFPVEREDSWRTPYVPLGEGSDNRWLEGTDAKFRANLRRRRRKLSARGPLTLRRLSEADPAALRSFYEIEGLGWKGRGGSAIACHPDTLRFYDEIAREAARWGYLCLYRLDLGGRGVAAHFGLAHRGRYFLPKPAYDERYREYSPGQLLMYAVLEDCAQRGYQELDFLGPSAEWKADWTERRRLHSVWHVFHHSLWGQTLHALRFPMRRAVKGLLGRPTASA